MADNLNEGRQTKAIKDSQLSAERKEAEEARKHIIEINTRIYEKAATYSNLIIFAGYIGLFAVWANMRKDMALWATTAVALLLVVSVLSFALFEVFKMATTAIKFTKWRRALLNKSSPAEFLAGIKSLQNAEEQHVLWIMPIWAVSLTLSVFTVLVAASILIYSFLTILLRDLLADVLPSNLGNNHTNGIAMPYVITVLAIAGICLTVGGAWFASRETKVSEDKAIEIGLSRFAGETREENLQLPAVQALITQSKAVQRGLIFIFLGAGLQVLAVILQAF